MARFNNSLFPHRVLEVIRAINWHHGYGEVREVHLGANEVVIHVPVTQRTYRAITRKFHFRGDSVVFARHQRKVRK